MTMFSRPAGERPCWQCRWFEAMAIQDTALCLNQSCARVRAQASTGCVKWERRPGTEGRKEPPVDQAAYDRCIARQGRRPGQA